MTSDEKQAQFRRDLIQAGLGAFAQEAGMLPKKCVEYLSKFITENPEMKEMKQYAIYLSDLDDPVYIHGESGTGKELIAQALHGGRTGNFVPLNCSAINTELFESELFGHVSGSFTGAAADRPGLMEAAANGTLFLDEIGDMPLMLQAKLLRAIQEKKIRRVGDNKYRDISCRIICATHRDLAEMVKQKQFREDLYWRLGIYVLHITPLRERSNDIMEIVDKLWPNHGMSPEEIDALSAEPLYGNVRELEFRVKRSILKRELTLTKYKL